MKKRIKSFCGACRGRNSVELTRVCGRRRFGRIWNFQFGTEPVAIKDRPVNADVQDVNVIFVEEPDDLISPFGIKGVGEIGIVGVAAAIANAIYHATGRRVRDLPITLDKLQRGPSPGRPRMDETG